ncbi:MAG TPA: MBL fold metallo-hydrolase [Polyangia bacterium]|nr:MBL fold metallo-hydrolase [Polyangia bacterium]
MPVAFRPGSALRFRLQPGTFLYDCHAGELAPSDGADLAAGFVPFFHAALFGVTPGAWHPYYAEQVRAIAALAPEERDAYVASLRPKRSLDAAARLAAFAFPDAERFVKLVPGAEGPFVLREELLFPGNPPLGALEGRSAEAPGWSSLLPEGALATAAGRAAVARTLARLARGEHAGVAQGGDPLEAAFLDAANAAGLLAPAERRPPAAAPPPGVYAVGHSALLIRGARTGLLIDPIFGSRLASVAGAFSFAELQEHVDAVALTHGHFDHYHLPTLLAAGDRPIFVPPVGRASIVCEDLAARLSSFGLRGVRAPAWGSTFSVGELTVHVLPFIGEQFLTSERYPEARNWGSSYVVEVAGRRVFVAADSGFEPGRSVIELVRSWCDAHGPIDVVAAQAIALGNSFGTGDADLQLTGMTCANRAPEAFALARREARVTLGVEDIPALCAATGATRFLPYGQFRFARGEPACLSGLVDRLARTLASARPETAVCALAIGQGLSLDPGGAAIAGALG